MDNACFVKKIVWYAWRNFKARELEVLYTLVKDELEKKE